MVPVEHRFLSVKSIMTRKKLLIISAIIIVIAAVFFTASKTKPLPKPPGFIQEPSIPKQLQGDINLTPKFTEKDFNFPKVAALLTIEKATPFTESEANSFGSEFGFSSQPDKVEDIVDGATYIWNNIDSSLIVYSKSRKIEYSLNEIPSAANKQLSDDLIKNTAFEFLQEKDLAENLDFSFFTFLEKPIGDEGISITTKASAVIYQVNFSPKVAQAKLLTLDPKTSPVYVWILPDGNIARASITKLGNVSKTTNTYPLKNYSQVISSIKSATIVSLDDGNIHIPNLSVQDIKNIDITEIELAYLLESPNTTTLQPIYTLKGTAEFVGLSQKVSAYLYLPAIQNP